MPDVKIWYAKDELDVPQEHKLVSMVEDVVAAQMSCYVPSESGPGYEFYELHGGEIDITVLQPFVSSEDTYLIIEVAAYEFPDRMRNITERLTKIARGIRRAFGLSDDAQVTISFIPIKQGHWVKI